MRNLVLSCLVFLIFSFSSCEKENDVSVNFSIESLVGTWSRIDVIPSGRSAADFRYFDMETIHTFGIDGSHSNKVNFYGFKDENPEEIIGQTENKGTFRIKSDSVFIRATELTLWEKGFNPEPETVELNGAAYGSRFEIKDNLLTLYYISYPADAPVATQMSYQRVD